MIEYSTWYWIVDIDDRVMVVSKAIQYINVKFINNPFKVKSFAGKKTNNIYNNEILGKQQKKMFFF